jgi:hypothetical protein
LLPWRQSDNEEVRRHAYIVGRGVKARYAPHQPLRSLGARVSKNQIMNNKTVQLVLGIGCGIGFGAYLYDVFKNLTNHLSLSESLITVDWKRILFMGVFVIAASYYYYNKKAKDKS